MFPQTDKENWQDFGLLLCSSLWHLPGLVVVSKENTYLSHAAQKRLHPSGPLMRGYLSAYSAVEGPPCGVCLWQSREGSTLL